MKRFFSLLAMSILVVLFLTAETARPVKANTYIGCYSSCSAAYNAAQAFCQSHTPGSFYEDCGYFLYSFRCDVDLGPLGYAEISPNCGN
jgi:hypothetical protein